MLTNKFMLKFVFCFVLFCLLDFPKNLKGKKVKSDVSSYSCHTTG